MPNPGQVDFDSFFSGQFSQLGQMIVRSPIFEHPNFFPVIAPSSSLCHQFSLFATLQVMF
jgi:hypothetical protein